MNRNPIELTMNQHFEVLRVASRDPALDTEADRKVWLRYAVGEFAKAMIAQGCVTVQTEYDIIGQRYIVAYGVLAGRKPLKLPGGESSGS